MEVDMTRGRRVKRWLGTLLCGTLSCLTCCCFCCGACGKIRSPRTMTLYDDDDDPQQTDTDRQIKNGLEWSMMASTTVLTAPLCGCCCCGFCGSVGPVTAAQFWASKKS